MIGRKESHVKSMTPSEGSPAFQSRDICPTAAYYKRTNKIFQLWRVFIGRKSHD